MRTLEILLLGALVHLSRPQTISGRIARVEIGRYLHTLRGLQ